MDHCPQLAFSEWILASASPRRHELLAKLGVKFRVELSAVDEWEDTDADPEALVRHNAIQKAAAVAAKFRDAMVLGSDTTVSLDGEVLNKPVDMDEARSMLRRLQGKTHTVFTAVAMVSVNNGIEDCFVESSNVRFKSLDDAAIEHYFSLVNPLDKAGAYGIQEGKDLIIAQYEGSLYNIMGLPIERLSAILRQNNWIL
jgi:septum formation protein